VLLRGESAYGSFEAIQALAVEQRLLGRCGLRGRVQRRIKRPGHALGVTRLVIAGAVVGDAKDPTANVGLRTSGCEVLVQGEKRVLHHVLRFLRREAQPGQVSQQGLAQFLKQRGGLTRIGGYARNGKAQG